VEPAVLLRLEMLCSDAPLRPHTANTSNQHPRDNVVAVANSASHISASQGGNHEA